MNRSVDLRFEANHPTAAGHFPSDPIIPGALLLDAVIAAIGAGRGTPTIRAAKYLRPIRPGDDYRLHWNPTAAGVIIFECRLGDAVAVTGSLAFDAVEP